MEKSMTEGRFLVFTVSAVVLLMLIHLYHSALSPYFHPENYLAIHTILEFFSITVSFVIFLYGWKTYPTSRSRKILLLSFLFFVIGVLDLLHTLTFKGMPFFITESSTAKATWFWVTARLIESFMMVGILMAPDRRMRHDLRPVYFASSTAIIAVISYIIFKYEGRLPLLFVEGEGTTTLKNTLEYGFSFLYFISIVISLYFYNESRNGQHLYVALAFTFLLLSELIFTIYQSAFDIDNFTGHVYKVIGSYFIMKGFFFSTTTDESATKDPEEKLWRQTEGMLQAHYGIIFRLTKERNDFIHQIVGGGLLDDLGFTPNEINGRTLVEFFPQKAAKIERYYECVWENNEKVVFDIEIGGHSYAISLMPVVRNGEVVEIAGAVMGIIKHARLERCSKRPKLKSL
ncbi:MASE3 domain-containing protein [Bacillus sp. REN3]|uniref:MASE3 domain-containing protein n=1 Tax=Bacillus sp. REN3 TaxID=2802440 RepID=UPI001AED80B3|nr:MASE3 domain-containing protein [Bacillus sp. REN3]